jgi:hypothetical protein
MVTALRIRKRSEQAAAATPDSELVGDDEAPDAGDEHDH